MLNKKIDLPCGQDKNPNVAVWVLLAVIILFTIFVRVRLIDIPFERDEGVYAYSARLMLQGKPPYSEVYHLKLPGLFAVYSLMMTLFGQTIFGVHFGLMVINVLTVVLMFYLGKRLLDESAGIMAAASFSLLSIDPQVLGFSANSEMLLLLPAISGVIYMLRAIESKRKLDYFFCGLLLGAAVIIKQFAALFIIFAGLYIIYDFDKDRSESNKVSIQKLLLYCAGVFAPFIIICILLKFAGVFDKFWLWNFKYALSYASKVPFGEGMERLTSQLVSITLATKMIWLVSAIGLTSLLWDKPAREKSVFFFAFSIFSFLAVCPGLYFRPHYFILMLPAVALMAGVGVSSISRIKKINESHILKKVVPVLIATFVILFTVTKMRGYLFSYSTKKIIRVVYGSNPFDESLEIAKYIEERTEPNGTFEA
ncbi:ArnT family glycosyltransferase [Thermodesulfobacteriota bacterium]